MNHKTLSIVAIMLIGVGLQGCHHSSKNNETAPTPPPTGSTPLSLGTQQVIERAQVSSETDTPLDVNGGAVTLAGTDEISDGAVVNR